MQRDIVARTFRFALWIVAFVPRLRSTDEGRIIGNQILRSGTSIGANVEEAEAGSSRADFIHKMNLALREARETHYWLRLVRRSNLRNDSSLDEIVRECDEIKRILGAIVSTSSGKRKPEALKTNSF